MLPLWTLHSSSVEPSRSSLPPNVNICWPRGVPPLPQTWVAKAIPRVHHHVSPVADIQKSRAHTRAPPSAHNTLVFTCPIESDGLRESTVITLPHRVFTKSCIEPSLGFSWGALCSAAFGSFVRSWHSQLNSVSDLTYTAPHTGSRLTYTHAAISYDAALYRTRLIIAHFCNLHTSAALL